MSVESCSGRFDTREVSDIQSNDADIVVGRISQSAQFRGGTWITTCRVNLPTLGRILSGELKPESAIGTCDQSAWHRMLHWSPMLTSPALVLL